MSCDFSLHPWSLAKWGRALHANPKTPRQFVDALCRRFQMSRTIRLFAAFVIATVALAACSDSSGTGTGLLTVRLTDAPFPFSQVKSVDIYVVRVDARRAEPTEAEA